MKKLIFYLMAFLLLSCNDLKTKFDNDLTVGYWLMHWEPYHDYTIKNVAYASCIRFNSDGFIKDFFFNKDGSVDSLNFCDLNIRMSKWKYTKDDSILKIVFKSESIPLKLVKINLDTIFLKMGKDMMYLKKDSPVWLVRYIPGRIPVSVGDSIYNF